MLVTDEEYPAGHRKGKFTQLCQKITGNELYNIL